MQQINYLVLLVCALLLSACSPPRVWVAPGGQVLEWPSGKPLEGVHVTGTWQGSIPQYVQAQSVCYHVAAAVTDTQGRYRLPTYTDVDPRIEDRWISYRSYKAGYKESLDERGRYRMREGNLYLEVDPRQGSARVKYLSGMSDVLWCGGGAGESEGAAYPALKAVYAEAVQQAAQEPEKSQRALDLVKFNAAKVAMWLHYPDASGEEQQAQFRRYQKGDLP